MPDGRGAGGGMYALLALVVILLVVIILFMTGTFGGRPADAEPDLDVRIETPSPQQPRN
jgi:hypothetical protein